MVFLPDPEKLTGHRITHPLLKHPNAAKHRGAWKGDPGHVAALASQEVRRNGGFGFSETEFLLSSSCKSSQAIASPIRV